MAYSEESCSCYGFESFFEDFGVEMLLWLIGLILVDAFSGILTVIMQKNDLWCSWKQVA